MSNTITDVDAEELRYEDPGSNSYKFYRVYIIGRNVLTQWGRIGTFGQTKVLSAPTESQAARMAVNKLSEKQAKGYHTEARASFSVNSDMANNPTAYVAKFSSMFEARVAAGVGAPAPPPRPNSASTDRNMNKLKKTLLRLSKELAD